jgi:flagellar hook-associated protein 2
MATGGISSPGVGSGLDVNGIVTQLVALERRPIAALQAKNTDLQTRLSALGQLQSLVGGVRDAAATLAKPETFTVMSVAASDGTVASATASATSPPAAGSHAVDVLSLSSAQTLASAAGQFSAATDSVGSGTLTLRLGAWNDALTSFTPKSGSTDVAISIAAGDSLSTVRDKINAANAGVSASVVTDATGVRLALRSTATGAANGFRLQVSDDDGFDNDSAGLSRLAYDPAAAAPQLTRTTAAADSRATVNGIELRSANNQLEGAIEGLNFKLAKVGSSTITVNRDTSGIKSQVAKFVSAFNALAKWLADQTRYDPSTSRAGLFQGDGAVVGIQTQLRSQLGAVSFASMGLQTLSSLGVELQKDGTVSLNGSRLESALADPEAVAAAFSRNTADQPMLTGAAVRLRDWADSLVAATGALTGRNKSLQSRIDANNRDQARLESRISLFEQRLRAQYSTLDRTVNQLNGLQGYVSQQLTSIANFNRRASE